MLKPNALYAPIAEYSEANDFDFYESHFHNHYEVYYLLKGRRRYIVENEIYDIKEDDIILIPPMVMHKTQKFPGTSVERHQRMLYNLREIPDILKPLFEKHFYRPEGTVKEEIRKLIDESVSEKSNDSQSMLLHRLNIHKILLLLLRMPKSDVSTQRLSHRDRLMQNAACYIKEHCNKSITLKQIAGEMGFTPEYFSSVFKSVTGFHFVDYLNKMRVARSLHLLAETDTPISAVSEMCGFNDSNYFAIVFKKNVGVSPRTYRNTVKNNPSIIFKKI